MSLLAAPLSFLVSESGEYLQTIQAMVSHYVWAALQQKSQRKKGNKVTRDLQSFWIKVRIKHYISVLPNDFSLEVSKTDKHNLELLGPFYTTISSRRKLSFLYVTKVLSIFHNRLCLDSVRKSQVIVNTFLSSFLLPKSTCCYDSTNII